MKTFWVQMSAIAAVCTSIEIEAETKEEAERKAIAFAKTGDASWTYNGVEDDFEITSVREVL